MLPVRRLFWLPLWLSSALIMLVLATLVMVSWRSLDRLQPVQEHLSHITKIQDVGLRLEQTLLKGLQGTKIPAVELQTLRDEVLQIANLESTVTPQSRERLREISKRLGDGTSEPLEVLLETVAQLRGVLAGERDHHDQLLQGVAKDNQTELKLAVSLLLALPLVGLALLLVLKRQIKHPLDDLGDLLVRLAVRDYAQVPDKVLNDTARVAQPAFRSYNDLVSRLQALEKEHLEREQILEREVRQATEALLGQSRELARSERLAAVGAVSAGLAHDLRNPLAGVQMACTKLRRSMKQPEDTARIDAVIGELKRVNELLTKQVDGARHAPEPLLEASLSEVIGQFLELVRYQVPEGVKLRSDITHEVVCALPAAGLRQALLNLVLNAVQVLDGNGEVIVSVHREDQHLAIRVSDNGPGFPEEMLRVGVRPFASSRDGGTGLGLAMVRRFVRDHDGELKLANREPHGAEVTMLLPCAANAQATKQGEKRNA